MMKRPSPPHPVYAASVAVATTAIAAVRIPAHTSGSAIGASTPRRSCRPDMPMPRAASRTSGSTATMPT